MPHKGQIEQRVDSERMTHAQGSRRAHESAEDVQKTFIRPGNASPSRPKFAVVCWVKNCFAPFAELVNRPKFYNL